MLSWTKVKIASAVLLAAAVVSVGVRVANSAEPNAKKLPGSNIIPADRLADWTLGVVVGVPGGIPTDRNHLLDVTKEPYNADSTGATNAQPAIQKAIADAADKDVVYLPAGTYRLDSALGLKSNMTLRGAGPDKTFLMIHAPSNGGITINGRPGGADWWYPDRLKLSITGSPLKGATELTLGDTKALDAYPNGGIGQICQVALKNDLKLPVVAPAHWDYMRKQESRIVARTATTVTISPGLLFDLPEALAPVLRPAGGHADFAGIEDLAVDGRDTNAQFGVSVSSSYGCWVKNVSVRNIVNYHLWMSDSVQSEVRHCYIATRKADAGPNGSGLLLESTSSSLFEDNIFVKGAAGVIASASAGNVFAYNFFDEPIVGDLLGASIITNHGAHPCFNLYEGNYCARFQSDGYHGSASHDTAFRNWFHGTSTKVTNYWVCINLNRFTRYYSLVGNVLGSKGHTWIYDNSAPDFPGFGYDQHFIYMLGMPNMGNGAFSGKAQPSKGKPWKDWEKMLAADLGKGPGPNGFQELDLDVAATTLLKGNFNYKDNAVPQSESLKGAKLPNSLYLKEKPAWFGNLNWPPFGPDTDFEHHKIPAQVRFEQMTKETPTETAK